MFILLLMLVAMASASIATYHLGLGRGFVRGAEAARKARFRQMQAHISGARSKSFPLSIEAFEEHCASTVASGHFGTPDWWSHICFKKTGECGEFSEHVGKASRDDGWSIFRGPKSFKPERRLALIKEIGDGWWYDIMILRELGSNAQECMLINIEKREGRVQRGTLKGSGDDR